MTWIFFRVRDLDPMKKEQYECTEKLFGDRKTKSMNKMATHFLNGVKGPL